MARVAQLWLRFHQQEFLGLRMVRRMASDAADVVLGVYGVDGVHVLRAAGVATHTASIDLFGRNILEGKYLAYVAAARHMVGARSVAAFATLLGQATFLVQCGLPVWRLFPGVVDFSVTGLAGPRSYVLRHFGKRRRCCTSRLIALIGNLLARWARSHGDEKEQDCKQKNSTGLTTF